MATLALEDVCVCVCVCVCGGSAVGGASESGAGLKLKQLSGRGLRCSQATPCLSKVWLT